MADTLRTLREGYKGNAFWKSLLNAFTHSLNAPVELKEDIKQ